MFCLRAMLIFQEAFLSPDQQVEAQISADLS